MNNNNFLNALGVTKGTVAKVIRKDATGKSKPAVYIEFQTEHGIISMRLNNPLNDYDKKKVSAMLAMVKVAKITDLVGKEFYVLAAPFEYNGKTLWNVRDIYDTKWPLIGEDPLDLDLGDGGNDAPPDESDELPF